MESNIVSQNGDIRDKDYGRPRRSFDMSDSEDRLFDQLDEDEKYLFDLARVMLFLKGYRKESLVLGYYLVSMLAKEVSRRTQIPFTSVRFLLPDEFILLLEGKLQPSLAELKERQKYMVFITGPEGTEI